MGSIIHNMKKNRMSIQLNKCRCTGIGTKGTWPVCYDFYTDWRRPVTNNSVNNYSCLMKRTGMPAVGWRRYEDTLTSMLLLRERESKGKRERVCVCKTRDVVRDNKRRQDGGAVSLFARWTNEERNAGVSLSCRTDKAMTELLLSPTRSGFKWAPLRRGADDGRNGQ